LIMVGQIWCCMELPLKVSKKI